MNKKVSLKDIAQKLGVSTALVSYVLNNRMEGRISKEIAQKIRETADEMKYRPNQIAKSLKTRRTYTIGLIVADISNPFSAVMARYIENAADEKNYTVIFSSSDENAEKCEKLQNVLLNRQVDGLILMATENAEPHIQNLQKQNIPFILIDRYYPELQTSYVAIDNHKAALEATRLLVRTGCRRIGLITHKTSLFHFLERKRGYLSGLKEAGIKAEKSLVREIRFSFNKDVEKAIDELLEEKADALLFTNNTLSTQGLKYINTLPLEVPRDLSIICFDETEASDLFYAPVTYIRQPLKEMGQLATRLLLDIIEQRTKTTQVNMEAEMIVRQSTRTPLPE